MANMCSVDFRMTFKGKDSSAKFADTFRNKMKEAEAKKEGVRISQDTWLFDTTLEHDDNSSITIRGWVNWGLTHEAIREFVKGLEVYELNSLECEYEEIGNLIYGKYEYHNGELWDSFIPEGSQVWNNYDDDDYYDLLEEALEDDGESVMVA